MTDKQILGGRGSAKPYTTLNTIEVMFENDKLKSELKAKEQEVDVLKAENGLLKQAFEDSDNDCFRLEKENDELKRQLKAKEQECEAYKMEAEEGIEINAELKAENEVLKQYKASKQASYESMQKEWNNAVNENRELKAENERFKVNKHQYCFAYDETCLTGNEKCVYYTCGFKSILKLKQTLAEIKEICNSVWGNGLDEEVDKFDIILKKISEVEDE